MGLRYYKTKNLKEVGTVLELETKNKNLKKYTILSCHKVLKQEDDNNEKEYLLGLEPIDDNKKKKKDNR